jgi:hypothetical protein
MLAAYLHIIRTTPILVAFEVVGAVLLVWFAIDRRLWEPTRLARFLRTGRTDDVRPTSVAGISRTLARVAAFISTCVQ